MVPVVLIESIWFSATVSVMFLHWTVTLLRSHILIGTERQRIELWYLLFASFSFMLAFLYVCQITETLWNIHVPRNLSLHELTCTSRPQFVKDMLHWRDLPFSRNNTNFIYPNIHAGYCYLTARVDFTSFLHAFFYKQSLCLITSSTSYDFMIQHVKPSYYLWEFKLGKVDHFYWVPTNALLEKHSPHLLDHCKQCTEEDDGRWEGQGDGWCWRYVMVVVVVVDSVRWLHCDVTINDANQRGRWRLGHRTEERRN